VAEWLKKNLQRRILEAWSPTAPAASLSTAFLKADAKLLAPAAGFFGVGERGVGGSKCGATAAVALLFTDPATGATVAASANVGDARALLRRGDGTVLQLSVDHVPDAEDERERIEATNPNRGKLPLVRFAGGTWRVGGLLALSRAFGDAHLKGSLQFEGLAQGGNTYSSGFGLIAEPTVTLTPLLPGDTHIIVASDGLNRNEERGGGGGIENGLAGAVAAACVSAAEAAAALADAAQEAGSTDDVTVVVLTLE
jgi:protein phosphatase 1K